MLTEQEMLQIGEQYLKRLEKDSNIEMMFYAEETIKKSYGNIYYFDSKEYLLNGNSDKELANKVPFLVEKETGRVVNFGTLGTIENQLIAYENGIFNPTLIRYWYPEEDRFDYK